MPNTERIDMIAREPRIDIDPDEEIVDLDSMTFDELTRERAEVKAEIDAIVAQLMDPERRPRGDEDDSQAWDDYRSWRRRARWARVYRQKELGQIKALLVERQEQRRVVNVEQRQATLARIAAEQPHSLKTSEQWAEHHARLAQQKQELLADLAIEGGADALLLRCKRLLSNLLPAASGQYEALTQALDDADRATLTDVGVYLLTRYGRANIKAYISDELAVAP